MIMKCCVHVHNMYNQESNSELHSYSDIARETKSNLNLTFNQENNPNMKTETEDINNVGADDRIINLEMFKHSFLQHMAIHPLYQSGQCQWSGCFVNCGNIFEFLHHLQEQHQVYLYRG